MNKLFSYIAISTLLLSSGIAVAEPLATINGTQDGFRLEITEMKNAEGFLTLRGIVHNDTQNSVDAPYVMDIYLVDNNNMKKYTVMTDSALQCVCSNVSSSFEPNSATKIWARFASPQDDVSKIGVVWGGFEPADAVPIGR
jgi:hypothetical protein